MRKKIKFFCLIFLLAACGAGEIKPVPIDTAADMCSFCRMAISEKRFAAEIITNNEEVFKFDDTGCLLRYQKANGDKIKIAAIFVSDYETREWIKADEAFFVRSTSVKTPMSGGILAFADKTKADAEAANSKTEVLRFDKLPTP